MSSIPLKPIFKNKEKPSGGPVAEWLAPLLGRKLLAWLLWPLMVLMVLDAVVGYFVTAHFASAAYDRTLVEVAREVMLQIKSSGDLPPRLPDSAERILQEEESEDKVFYRVIRLSDQASAGEQGLPPPPARPSAKPVFYDAVVDSEAVRVVALAGKSGEDRNDNLLVLVAETANKRQLLFREIVAGVVLPQLILAILVGALVWIGVVRGLAPLRRLEQSIARRSHLDLSPLVVEQVPGGVRPLVDEINALMQRLSEVLEFQNRFIADAAHQLRTPVAGLKAQFEMAMRESDPERMKHSMDQIYMGMSRLSRLVAQLLSLARNEPNAVKQLQLNPMDLNRLVFDTTMEWVPEALRKGIDLGFDGDEEPLMIKGDPARLKELINNLFDNAIRYTPDNGRVTARVLRTPVPTFAISDDGPAIPVEERERVFERFHRLLGTNTEGSGLGLAIVNEIAKLHGASVTLMDDKDGIGNTFVVSFPKAT